MPKHDRERLIKNIYDSLIPGGAFVFAEKVYSQNAHIQDMITFMYYDYKRKYFEDSDILDKEKTLRHMLKPNTWPEINDFLTTAGFKNIQVFWRNHNFLGAIAVK
jgi:tRNA (cmo5U34)-methyltransferase